VTGAATDTALDAALMLSSDGLFCLPCLNDKRWATPHGFKHAQRDPNALLDLWRQYPALLVGVATGAICGLDVLDLDCKHFKAREWWAANRDRLPSTGFHRTRSDGLHLLFRYAAGVRSTAGKITPDVDTRGDGGYTIWWPAARFPVLKDVSPAPWPAWLLAQLQRSPETSRRRSPVIIPDDRALGRLVRLVAGAPEGQRNNLAFWAACRAGEMARSGLIALETATAVIAAAAMGAGLSKGEAERTARSGVLAGAGVANV
jgi:hypothetical protein